jgi:hypothetical protein
MNTELSTITTLALFETSKQQRENFCVDVINQIENGVAEPLKVHAFVKSMEDVVKLLNDNKRYKNLVLEAAEQNGKKFQMFNAEFSVKEVGVKYDYSQCNDPELLQWNNELEQLTEKIKSKQKFLQTVPLAGLEIVVDDEMVKVYPPSKSSTTSVAVTLK